MTNRKCLLGNSLQSNAKSQRLSSNCWCPNRRLADVEKQTYITLSFEKNSGRGREISETDQGGLVGGAVSIHVTGLGNLAGKTVDLWVLVL